MELTRKGVGLGVWVTGEGKAVCWCFGQTSSSVLSVEPSSDEVFIHLRDSCEIPIIVLYDCIYDLFHSVMVTYDEGDYDGGQEDGRPQGEGKMTYSETDPLGRLVTTIHIGQG